MSKPLLATLTKFLVVTKFMQKQETKQNFKTHEHICNKFNVIVQFATRYRGLSSNFLIRAILYTFLKN